MTYTIYHIMPKHCPITDAIIGTDTSPAMTGFPIDMLDAAEEKCAEFNQAHADADFHFVVAGHGYPYTKRVQPVVTHDTEQEIPW
jgi:hypothetical protein